MERENMELYSWSSDFELPTWHQECLAIQTYTRFSGAPVTIKSTDNPFWIEDLPYFIHGKNKIDKFDDFVEYMKKCNFNLDVHLQPKQISLMNAQKTMIWEKLKPALAFIFWVDSKNFTEVTRPWYAKHLPFPLNFYYPGVYWKKANYLLESSTTVDCINEKENGIEFSLMEKSVSRKFEECLNCISTKIGNKSFFFGDEPTSLDALIFSYLAPIIQVESPSNSVSSIINKYPNLKGYVSNIISTYFPKLKKAKKEETKSEDSNGNKIKGSWINTLSSVTIVVIAMTGYAYSMNITRIFKLN